MVPSQPPFHPVRAVLAALAAGTAAAVLSGCSSIAAVQSADDAANPACASMMVVLPDVLADLDRRETNSQGTAAWGDPAQVVLRCGVTVPGPSTDPCVSVNGVDWVAREGTPGWTLTTYGRTPATEVLFDPNQVPSSTVLAELAPAAAKIPAQGGCTSVDTSVDLP